jgi:hypothetical protein
MAHDMANCYSYARFCSLGPLPPRTPARPDAQVPTDRKLGPCTHGRIDAFYFYANGSDDDPAFGFCDIEISVQRVEQGTVRVELYCIADGYQSARGVGTNHPLKIAVIAKDGILGVVDWHFADVICGHADPMHFAANLEIDDGMFDAIDCIELQKTEGQSRQCE